MPKSSMRTGGVGWGSETAEPVEANGVQLPVKDEEIGQTLTSSLIVISN
jgi:hypothetical protein